MTWWLWVALALVLGLLEVLMPVFVFLGFSAGALATAALVAVGLDAGLGGTLVIFALLSAGAYAVLRFYLGQHRGRARIIRKDINEN
nr:hypothetical protein [Rubellimicrobium arenae]